MSWMQQKMPMTEIPRIISKHHDVFTLFLLFVNFTQVTPSFRHTLSISGDKAHEKNAFKLPVTHYF